MHTHEDALAPRITVRGVLHWFRDRFAAFFASLTAWTLAWVAWAMLAVALFYWDGLFTRSLAPSYVREESFMAVGWGLRVFVFVLPLIALRLWSHRLRAWAVVIGTLWVVMQGIAYSHAFGFAVSGLEERRDLAQSVTEVNTADREGVALQVQALEAQKEGVRADRDQVIDAAQSAIQAITTDGINNDDQADPYRQTIVEANTEAGARIAAIDARINELFAEKRSVATDGAAEEATAREFNPLFGQFATAFDGEDGDPRRWAIIFFLVLMAAVELIVALFPALFDTWQARVGKRAAERETEREEAEHRLGLAEIEAMRREADDAASAQRAALEAERARFDAEMATLRETLAQVTANPVQVSDNPPGPLEAPQEEQGLTPAQVRGRKGGRARQHYREQGAHDTALPIGPVSVTDQRILEAAE